MLEFVGTSSATREWLPSGLSSQSALGFAPQSENACPNFNFSQ
jgi:hypothetical protein